MSPGPEMLVLVLDLPRESGVGGTESREQLVHFFLAHSDATGNVQIAAMLFRRVRTKVFEVVIKAGDSFHLGRTRHNSE